MQKHTNNPITEPPSNEEIALSNTKRENQKGKRYDGTETGTEQLRKKEEIKNSTVGGF